MKTIKILFFIILAGYCNSFPQNFQSDSVKIDWTKISSRALDADVSSALILLDIDSTKLLSEKDKTRKQDFEKRFKFDDDISNYLENRSKYGINDLLKIYVSYWREALLNKSKNYDTTLSVNLLDFFKSLNGTDNLNIADSIIPDTLNSFVKNYINGKGLYTTGFGMTGKLLDLLVWKSQIDTVYKIKLYSEELDVRVCFMQEFVTLGWEEYATFGVYYPGGWATGDALYCVRDAYDINSENFTVSYLSHEGRHFSDYKLFENKLSGAELEYRAKLTELSLAKETSMKLISFFLSNANFESNNSHSIANYFVIRDLSKKIFKVDYEKDFKKWEALNTEIIRSVSNDILDDNTEMLKKQGKNIEHFIKK